MLRAHEDPASEGGPPAPDLRPEMDSRFEPAVREITGYGVCLLDRTGRIQTWNRGAEQMSGYSPAEVTGRPLSILRTPEDIARGLPETALAAAATTGSHEEEGWRVRKDASRFWALVSITALHNDLGDVRGFVEIIRDVTERRRAEHELSESRRLLSDAQALAGLGSWEWDIPGNRLTWSDQLYRIFGVDRHTFEPTYESYLGQIHPDDREMVQQVITRAAEDHQPFDFVHRIVRPGGRTGHLHCRGQVECDAAGTPLRMFGATRDITAERNAEERQQEHARELERSNAELEQFAHVASHDLQEPLRMVTSYVQLLKRRYGGQLGEDADDYIAFAVDGTTRMSTLISDLLSYSRAGRNRPEATHIRTADLVDATRHNLENAIREAGAEISVGELPEIEADANQLIQVFQNLIANAIKFHGEAAPRVEISAQRRGDHWEFAVADNGIGIPAEHLERVFEVFRRLHTREEYPGSGMGLAICRKVVERHGGRIWAESEPGHGSTFRFTLPVTPQSASPK